MNAHATMDLQVDPRTLGADPADSHARLEERLRWLTRTQAELARTCKRSPWLALSALAAVPVGLLWGAFAAAAVAGFGVTLPMVIFYLSWCHQQEYAAEEALLRRNLADPDAASGVMVTRPWRVRGKLTTL